MIAQDDVIKVEITNPEMGEFTITPKVDVTVLLSTVTDESGNVKLVVQYLPMNQ